MSDIVILLVFLLAARWIVIKTKPKLLRTVSGPILGGIMAGFIQTDIVEGTWISFFVIVISCIYLMYLSDKPYDGGK